MSAMRVHARGGFLLRVYDAEILGELLLWGLVETAHTRGLVGWGGFVGGRVEYLITFTGGGGNVELEK